MSTDPELNGDQPAGTEPDPDRPSHSLAGRIFTGGTRQVQKVAGATGLDRALETALEDAIVAAVESDATERALARIINGPVIEQAVQEALRSEAVEQALLETVDSDLVERLWGKVLDSDETQKLIERIAEAPEIRGAIASQGVGLIGDVGREVSQVTRRLDGIAERIARRLTFRSPVEGSTDHAGIVTRGLALALDALTMNITLITCGALVSLVAQFFGADLDHGWAKGALAAGAFSWFVLSSLYLFTFWAIAGQTPGMRFLGIRIEHEGNRMIGPRFARRRLVGFWLAALPFGLGFLGVLFRSDRRGFNDRFGRTTVYYVDEAAPDTPHQTAPR